MAGRRRALPVFRRNEAPEQPHPGPALVLDYGATTLVTPGWSFRVDNIGNLILLRKELRMDTIGIFLRYIVALIVYGVLAAVLFMLRKVAKDIAEIKRSIADIEHTLMVQAPKEPV